MVLSFIAIVNTVLLAIFFIGFVFVCIALFRTMLFKNERIKVLSRTSLSSEKINEYQKNMKYLFSNDLVSALEKIFSICFVKGKIKKIGNSYIYEYRSNNIDAENILIDVPLTSYSANEIVVSQHGISGENTYNSKSQLYCVFDALENVFLQNENININLNIAIYEKENTNEEIVNYLYEKNEKMLLTLGEGGKILDPIVSGFRSYYALIGVATNEEVVIRYKTKKIGKGEERLKDFISEITDKNLFELKLENEMYPTVTRIAKDMTFGNRFILNNIHLFPKLSRRIIEEEYTEINKAWKTSFACGEIIEDDGNYYVDIKFNASFSDDEKKIIELIEPFVLKYGIEYSVINKKEKSDKVSIHSNIYKLINSIVDESFSELYTTSYVINEEINDYFSQKISENIIRFIPLYYSRDALVGMKTGNEEVTFSSLDKATSFYEELFIQVGGKTWKNKK